jgi:hypothetical protein
MYWGRNLAIDNGVLRLDPDVADLFVVSMGHGSSSATPRGGDKKDYTATQTGVTPGGEPTPTPPLSNNNTATARGGVGAATATRGGGGVTTNVIIDDNEGSMPMSTTGNPMPRPLPNGGLAAMHHQHHDRAVGNGNGHAVKDKFKVVMLGGEKVGKSAIFRRYITNQFITEHIPTTRGRYLPYLVIAMLI